MATIIKASIQRENSMERVNIVGQMGHLTKVTLYKV